jgi:hypothetical protein
MGRLYAPLQIKQLTNIKLLIPTNIYQDLDSSIKLNDGLRRERLRLRAEEGRECEHAGLEI